MPSHGMEDEDKPCRACSDFKSWAKSRSKVDLKNSSTQSSEPEPQKTHKECPLDKNELGRATWGFLHSMASYYPDKPTRQQSEEMAKFLQIFGQFYPCEPCSIDFLEDIKKNPPKTKSRAALAKWLCERHNTVNKKIHKPLFDCSKVDERWRDGWKDGSCD